MYHDRRNADGRFVPKNPNAPRGCSHKKKVQPASIAGPVGGVGAGIANLATTGLAGPAGVTLTPKPARIPKPAKQPKTPAPIAATMLVNHFALVVDRSVSMGHLTGQVIEGYNRQVEAIRAGATQHGQFSTVTQTLFGSTVQILNPGAPVAALQPFTVRDYIPNDGSTALLDGIGDTIERMKLFADAQNPNTSFVLVVITDGEENSSRRFTAPRLKQLIADVQATGRWTVSLLVPRGARARTAMLTGIPEGNIAEWETTKKGAEVAFDTAARAVSTFGVTRSLGQTASQNFYLNVNDTAMQQAKASMTDIRDLVKVWTVDKEQGIQEFVESKGYQYVIGRAFYQLTKPETIQGGKNVLIMEKTSKAVYQGNEARQALGLPTFGDVKAKPGNLGNWDLYIQSTSTNRKLVRGAKLIYVVK